MNLDYNYYLGQAINFLNVREDAEDACQEALLLFLKYKSLDTKNPEKTINWLVKQECIRIYRQKNGITVGGTGKHTHGRVYQLDGMDERYRRRVEARRFDLNEGGLNYDMEAIGNRKDDLKRYFEVRDTKPVLRVNLYKDKNGYLLGINEKRKRINDKGSGQHKRVSSTKFQK